MQAEFTRHEDGTRSIALSAPVPYDTLPRPERLDVYGSAYIKVPAFDGILLFGMLENERQYCGFCMLIAGGRALITASFAELAPIRSAEVHGIHLLLHTEDGECLRIIPSEDGTAATAELL